MLGVCEIEGEGFHDFLDAHISNGVVLLGENENIGIGVSFLVGVYFVVLNEVLTHNWLCHYFTLR